MPECSPERGDLMPGIEFLEHKLAEVEARAAQIREAITVLRAEQARGAAGSETKERT